MKIAIYTAMTGNYDKVETPKFIDKDVDYFFFTDQDLSVPTVYNRITLPKGYRLDKDVKILSHKYLPDYDIVVWKDASINQLDSVHRIIDNMDRSMAFLSHKGRMCITEELEACAYYKKGELDVMNKQVQTYLNEGFPLNYGLYEAGFSVRYHKNKEVQAFNEAWMKEVREHSLRDQLSLPYVLWKTGVEVNHLHPCTIRGREFVIHSHIS